MADRIEWFDITVPAGVLASAPTTFPTKFRQGDVVQIDVKIPPGPAGNVGFYIQAGGSQFIPRTPGTFIIPDDDVLHWPQSNAINSGSWAVVAYNTDVYVHLIQVSFQINEVTMGAQLPTGLPVSL